MIAEESISQIISQTEKKMKDTIGVKVTKDRFKKIQKLLRKYTQPKDVQSLMMCRKNTKKFVVDQNVLGDVFRGNESDLTSEASQLTVNSSIVQ